MEYIKYHLAKIYTLAVQNNVDLDQVHLFIEAKSKEYVGRAQRERDMQTIQQYHTYYDMYVRPVQQPIPPNNNAYTKTHIIPYKRTSKLSNKPLAPIVPDEGE